MQNQIGKETIPEKLASKNYYLKIKSWNWSILGSQKDDFYIYLKKLPAPKYHTQRERIKPKFVRVGKSMSELELKTNPFAHDYEKENMSNL